MKIPPSTNGGREGNGPEGIRTPDLLGAIQARSQLRHGPEDPDYTGRRATCEQVAGDYAASRAPSSTRRSDDTKRQAVVATPSPRGP